MEEHRFTVKVTAEDDVAVYNYLWDLLERLDTVEGVSAIKLKEEGVDRNWDEDGEPRDISEVYRILGDLSDHEIERLSDAINSYTEEDE